MTESILVPILIAVLSSSALTSFIQFLISRKDKQKDDLEGIKEQLIKLEKDTCRTQLLILMSDYPDRQDEIMRLSKHYFRDLKGNWYLTTMFSKWLSDNKIEKPSWFE